MKTNTQTSRTVNLKTAAINIFKTIMLLPKSYGSDYLSRILQGFDRYGLKDESHRELDTFGCMEELFRERISNMINYLRDEEYLEVGDQRYGNLKVTPKASSFMENPEDILVSAYVLNTSEWDRLLAAELRQIRRDAADKAEVMPYEIFTNYTLDSIVKNKPGNVTELKSIPGIGDYKIKRYGKLIFDAVSRVADQKSIELVKRREQRAQWPSQQQVKDLFLSGKTIEEIAAERCVKPVTVMRSLENLHLVGELDMTAWIEAQVPKKDLQKGTKHFQNSKDLRLKEAYEKLGLDYETLRLCRLYVANVATEESELAMAG